MSQKHCVAGSTPAVRTKDMEYTAYLSALLETDRSGEAQVRHFTITSDEHPTCSLQTQSYAIIDRRRGASYDEARRSLSEFVRYKAAYSAPNSLWHRIWSDIKES